MREQAEQMYLTFWVDRNSPCPKDKARSTTWLPQTLPPALTNSISEATATGTLLPPMVQEHLRVILEDPHLKRRCKNNYYDKDYMHRVDFIWRDRLYLIAKKMAKIIEASLDETQRDNVAIILYGSVARGTVKTPTHNDPSNIDIAVIGSLDPEEEIELFDQIRSFRKQQEKVIGNNLGVHIQSPEKVRNGNYGSALNYIGSCARTLYDPAGIWESIEHDALLYSIHQNASVDIKSIKRSCYRLWRKDYANCSQIDNDFTPAEAVVPIDQLCLPSL